MKRLFLIIVITACCTACNQPIKGSNGQVYKSAIQYNDYIVDRQSIIMKNIMDVVKASETSLDSAEKLLDKYIAGIDVIVIDVKGMPPYKGDSALRDAAINTFGFYRRIFDNNYRQIIHIRQNGGAETPEGAAQMNGIVDQITKEEKQYDDAFHNAQRNFADKNNMRLTENKMQKKLDDMK